LNIHQSSVQRIVKRDLHLSAFRRVPAQVIPEAVKQKRRRRYQKLIRRLPLAKAKTVFFSDEKNFYLNPQVNHQKIVFGLRVRRETLMNVGW